MHDVKISVFYMAIHEVTQAQYQALMDSIPASSPQRDGARTGSREGPPIGIRSTTSLGSTRFDFATP